MDMQYLEQVAEFNVRKAWKKFVSMNKALEGKPCPRVELSKRLKTTAGLAFLANNMVRISADLLWEHTEEMCNSVIPHEVAHIVAYILQGDQGHGKAWKNHMVQYGLPPARCHSLVNSKHAAAKAARVGK